MLASILVSCYILIMLRKKFDLNPRDILVELGKRRMVGGQEDMIIDVSHALKYGS